ncbi:MAG: SAM-dependent methyltransferase [Brachybacterium faecium]|nr:MAG: SAM-dependent methyltransferase [Brachybacterium faecium]
MSERDASSWQGPMTTVPPGYFVNRYDDQPDPWNLSSSRYEERKRRHVLETLPRDHYRCGYEPGCGRGDLTRLLAPRVTELWAVEVVAAAVASTWSACVDYPHVRVTQADVRHWTPPRPVDLIVFSEILYYFSPADFRRVVETTATSLAPGADVIAVHRRRDPGKGWDAPQLHEWLTSGLRGVITATERNSDYEIAVIDVA